MEVIVVDLSMDDLNGGMGWMGEERFLDGDRYYIGPVADDDDDPNLGEGSEEIQEEGGSCVAEFPHHEALC